MKRLFRLAWRLASVVVVFVVLLAGWLVWRSYASIPALDGTVTHASLQGEVRVVRDDYGVPHIYAEHEADAYFALGYSQAQDRLFQMELMRRLAQGKLAEILGPYVAPEIDVIARSFRLLPKAREHEALYKDSHPKIQAMAEAYCAGINHFVDTGELPVEFSILGIPPHRYEPADCMSVAAILPISFADGIREDPLQGMLERQFPDMDLYPFFPGYHEEDAPVTVMETIEEAQAFLRGEPQRAPEEFDEEPKTEAAPPSDDAEEARALRTLMQRFATLTKTLGHHLGSNSWVMDGSKTASGKPLLANDPHIAFFNPSIWYEAQIECDTFSLYGYYLPLIPMTLIGHNEHLGWALTMFANDDVDLFVEEFHPDDPGLVKYRGEWVPVEEEDETIRVRFGSDIESTVRVTRHGPVITDLLEAMLDYEGPPVSLSWVWQHLDYTDLLGFYEMARATTYDEFREGVSKITSPGLNVSYADAEGNIAWWAAGRIPVRPKHVNNKTLLDGASGQDEIEGYVPFDENPHLKNPEQGFIVTANNKSTVKPVGPVDDLEGYWQPIDRAGRIEEVLASKPGGWTVEEMKALQFDDKAYVGEEIAGIVLGVLQRRASALSPAEQAARDALADWDFQHAPDSIGASIYWVTHEMILEGWAGDEMGDALAIYDSLADSWNSFKHSMRHPELPQWDDRTTDAKETQDDIVLAAFQEGVAALARNHGSDMENWTWGNVHQITFSHPLGYLPGLGGLFNIGPFPATGSPRTPNNMIYTGKEGLYSVVAGPSTRRVIDFADPTVSWGVLPTGNSGHFLSPHYDDQSEMFVAGEYRTLAYTREQVEAARRHELVFAPAPE